MDPVSPRQTDIVRITHEVGRVNVEDLAQQFNVTAQTIRRDLNDLCKRGLLQRFHGGAVPASGVINSDYSTRHELASEEKRRIGQHAGSLIPDNCSVMINIGTTTEQVALTLQDKKNLLVITNNINVVNILRSNQNIEVIVAGGIVRPADGGVVGEPAVDFIKQFKVDYAIMGVSAIDEDGSLLDYDYREVKVAKTIMSIARRSILVTDSMKFKRSAPVRIGHVSQLYSLVTNETPPDAIVDICKDSGVELEIAP